MNVSSRGLRLIETFEGWSSAPYWDPYGKVWTRGFGETENIGPGSAHLTLAEGQARLKTLVEHRYEFAINDLRVNFNQNEYDALCSFVWNLGTGIFTGALRENLQDRQFMAAAQEMIGFDHAGGVVLPGLKIRREDEVHLFLKQEIIHDPLAVLEPKERKVANSFELYNRHPHLHPHGLQVSRESLIVFRKEIWSCAERGHTIVGTPVHRGWNVANRRDRYHELKVLTG
jgi:lysozyme